MQAASLSLGKSLDRASEDFKLFSLLSEAKAYIANIAKNRSEINTKSAHHKRHLKMD